MQSAANQKSYSKTGMNHRKYKSSSEVYVSEPELTAKQKVITISVSKEKGLMKDGGRKGEDCV